MKMTQKEYKKIMQDLEALDHELTGLEEGFKDIDLCDLSLKGKISKVIRHPLLSFREWRESKAFVIENKPEDKDYSDSMSLPFVLRIHQEDGTPTKKVVSRGRIMEEEIPVRNFPAVIVESPLQIVNEDGVFLGREVGGKR